MKILILAIALIPALALASQGNIFTNVSATSPDELAALNRATTAPSTRDAAVTTIRVNPAIFRAGAGATFHLALGPGYTVTTAEIVRHANGIATFIGTAGRGSLIALTRAANGAVLGSIATPDGSYTVRAVDAALSLLIDKPYSSGPIDRGAKATPKTSAEPSKTLYQRPMSHGPESTANTGTASGPTVITLLFAYTPRIPEVLTGTTVLVYIDNMIDGANAIYKNSHIDLTFKLAGTIDLGFGDDLNLDDMLKCASGNGADNKACNQKAVTKVDNLRAITGADEVVTLTANAELAKTAGVAYEGGVNCGAAPDCFRTQLAFAVLRTAVGADYALAHELGHTLGAGHDVNADDHNGAFPYSHAHLSSAGGTVMYGSDRGTVPLFSSPDLTCGGAPCGNAKTEDNARTIARTKADVAGFSDRPLKIFVDGGYKKNYPFSVAQDAAALKGIFGDRFNILLLKNGQSLRGLGYGVTLHNTTAAANDNIDSLPANIDGNSVYTLKVTPVYRPDMAVESKPLKPKLSPPKVVSLAAGKVGQTRAIFQLSANTFALDTKARLIFNGNNASGFNVLLPGEPFDAKSGSAPSSETVLFYNGLTCGTSYRVGVDLTSAGGETRWDDSSAQQTISIKTLPCGGAAPKINGLSARASANGELIQVAAEPNKAAATQVAIEYSDGGAHSLTAFQSLSKPNTLAFTLTGLDCGRTYTYRAVAYAATGATAGAAGDSTFQAVACRPGTLSLSGPAKVDATDGTATYTVTRSGGADGVVTVSYATKDGKAKGSHEYLPISSKAMFHDGETKKTIAIPLLLSPMDAGGYDYTLALGKPSNGASLGSKASVKTEIRYVAVSALPPTAGNGSVKVKVGSAVTGTLTGKGSGTVTFTIATKPKHGTAMITSSQTGAFSYQADGGYSGQDSFTFKVTDGAGESAMATEFISIEAASPPPAQPSPPPKSGGGGGGALDVLALLALLASCIVRRTQLAPFIVTYRAAPSESAIWPRGWRGTGRR